MIGFATNMFEHIVPWTKWPTCCRWQVLSPWSNKRYISIESNNGLAPNISFTMTQFIDAHMRHQSSWSEAVFVVLAWCGRAMNWPSLLTRYTKCHRVSNYHQLACWFNSFYILTSTNTSKLLINGPSLAEFTVPWWRHRMKHFPCYWPFVRGIHRAPRNSPHKGLWRGALVFSLV